MRNSLPWQPEASYVVPCAAKDSLPHASEGNRMLALELTFRNLLDDMGFRVISEDAISLKTRASFSYYSKPLCNWLIMSFPKPRCFPDLRVFMDNV